MLPGGLAQALGRDDFELPWPGGGSSALPGMGSAMTAMTAMSPASAAGSPEGEGPRSAEGTGEEQVTRGDPRRSSSPLHAAVRELGAAGLSSLGEPKGSGSGNDGTVSNLASGVASGVISSAAPASRVTAARVVDDIAAGSGPAPASLPVLAAAPAAFSSSSAPSAVPSEISESTSPSVAMASAVPEAELLVEETKPRGK